MFLFPRGVLSKGGLVVLRVVHLRVRRLGLAIVVCEGAYGLVCHGLRSYRRSPHQQAEPEQKKKCDKFLAARAKWAEADFVLSLSQLLQQVSQDLNTGTACCCYIAIFLCSILCGHCYIAILPHCYMLNLYIAILLCGNVATLLYHYIYDNIALLLPIGNCDHAHHFPSIGSARPCRCLSSIAFELVCYIAFEFRMFILNGLGHFCIS